MTSIDIFNLSPLLITTKLAKMKIQVNRNELQNDMCDIEDMVCAAIKTDLGAKKGSVTCTTRHWQGHTCPEFKGIFDGVKIAIYGDISEFDLEVDPMNYEMYFTYTFIEKN